MIPLAFERGGTKNGAVLLLIHPMGADLRFWDPCRAIWQSEFECIAMDLPAAGATGDPGGVLSPQFVATCLAKFVQDQKLDKIIPVGCAVGAMAAVALAALLPEKTIGLILTNPGLKTSPGARQALASRGAAARTGGMAAILPATLDIAFEGQERGPMFVDFSERFARQNADLYARQIDGLLDADIGPELERVGCPTLVFVGGHDRLLPAEIGQNVANSIEDSKLVNYPDAAHFIPWQTPDLFAEDSKIWIERL